MAEILTGGGTSVIERPRTDDGSDTGEDDWFTIRGVVPWRCPCGATGIYMAEDRHPHRIVVWPSADDPSMLKILHEMVERDHEKAAVVPYEKSMGPCVSHYKLKPS